MGKKSDKVYGVGINDSLYPVYITERFGSKRKVVWTCPFYKVWNGMMERCYSERLHLKYPSYKGCMVIDEWRYFSAFREWMLDQSYEGNELDKDLLVSGNKIYGPNTCLFISQKLNSFLTHSKINNSGLPIGSFMNGRGYAVKCNNPFTGKREYLGTFKTIDLAVNSWKERKRKYCILLSYSEKDKRVKQALLKLFKEV